MFSFCSGAILRKDGSEWEFVSACDAFQNPIVFHLRSTPVYTTDAFAVWRNLGNVQLIWRKDLPRAFIQDTFRLRVHHKGSTY